MSFPWLETARPRGRGDRHSHVALAELAARAGTFYRLGFTEAAATARLIARVAWEYDPASKLHHRPAALSDAAIAKVVAETYARRPG